MHTVRHNWFAIVTAALVLFMIEGAWFTVFQQQWLEGVGRTLEQLRATGESPILQYGIALASALIMATVLSWAIQATGQQSLSRGIQIAALLWLGFVLTTWITEYVFEVRTLRILAINTGVYLVGLAAQGAILGAWKRKA